MSEIFDSLTMNNNSIVAGNSVVFLDIEIAQEKSKSNIYLNYIYFYYFEEYQITKVLPNNFTTILYIFSWKNYY